MTVELVWTIAVAGLFAAFALAAAALIRGSVPQRLAALPIAGTLGAFALAALSFLDSEPSTIDLALALGLLSLPGTLLYALFEERWL